MGEGCDRLFLRRRIPWDTSPRPFCTVTFTFSMYTRLEQVNLFGSNLKGKQPIRLKDAS